MYYKVVCVQSANYYDAARKLAIDVEEALRDGWRPQGGVSVAVNQYEQYTLCQALVK